MERVLTLAFKNNKGKFSNFEGQVIGKVLPDGKIEGTDMKFDPREIHGGVAISRNASVIRLDDNTLKNPATGERFLLTHSGKGYYSKDSGVFLKVWNEQK